MNRKKINLPLTEEVIKGLKCGDSVLISGTMYTARDAAHMKLVEAISEGKALPVDLAGNTFYYAGPTPTRPGNVSGSFGPTTAGRMDKMAPLLLDRGLKGMIGKGERSEDVKDAIVRNKCVYFIAVGGAGALISNSIKSIETAAYPELGTEAIRKIEVEKFPAIVGIDCEGNDIYKQSFSCK